MYDRNIDFVDLVEFKIFQKLIINMFQNNKGQ